MIVESKKPEMYAMQPITYATGAEIQAPYRAPLQPGNVQAGVALGPTSRMEGECLARHGSIPGMCWGKFSSQNTRAVDQYDPTVSQALTTQWALASTPFNTLNQTGNITNNMSYASSAPIQVPTQSADPKVAKKQAAAQAKALKAAQKEAQKADKAKAAALKKASKSSGGACSRNGSCQGCE